MQDGRKSRSIRCNPGGWVEKMWSLTHKKQKAVRTMMICKTKDNEYTIAKMVWFVFYENYSLMVLRFKIFPFVILVLGCLIALKRQKAKI